MDIQLEKLELIKLLAETENPSIIKDIKKIFHREKKDWWEDLSDEQKAAIEEGLDDIKNGRVFSYEEMKKEFGLL
jgi:predicted transcriptional regulator